MSDAAGKSKLIKAPSPVARQRTDDLRHERMLVSINEHLPHLIAAELQSSKLLNEELAEKRDDWAKKIEKLISQKLLSRKQAKIWRSVPRVTYASPDSVLARIRYCVGLKKATDPFSARRTATGSLYAADFVAEFSAKVFDIYLRDGSETSYLEEPIVQPSEGISLREKQFAVILAGGIYPGTMTIGSVAADMGKLVDAIQQSESGSLIPILATDREEIFNVLSQQYDALLFDELGKLVAFDLGQVTELIRQHKYR